MILCALYFPLLQSRVQSLRLAVLLGVRARRTTRLLMREKVKRDDLSDLEEDDPADEDDEVAAPHVRDVDIVAGLEVDAALNNLLAGTGAE